MRRMEGRSPATTAARRPVVAADPVAISAPVSLLPARLEVADMPGPVVVMIGRVFDGVAEAALASAEAPGADARAN